MPRLILGHTTDSTIKLWVRGSERWPVAFVDVLDKAKRRTSQTKILSLDSEEFWTDVVEWSGLSPNKEYLAMVAFGKSEDDDDSERIRDAYTEGKFQTFPDENSFEEFTFMLGSCNLHSLGVIKNPDKAWSRISSISGTKEARFMIHCGDQIYSDIPLPPNPDPNHYRNKYLDAWDDCRTARAYLTEISHYMILDDHEITNNFDQDMDHWAQDHQALKNAAMKAYWEFQHKHNPDTKEIGKPRRYYYSFDFGEVKFFVLDTRSQRSSIRGELIDQGQFDQLKEWLLENKSKLKFIVTSVPFIGQLKSPKKDKWCSPSFSEQRGAIFHFLHSNGIEKTTFLTGDMHHSYHASAKIGDLDSSITVHELMSSQ